MDILLGGDVGKAVAERISALERELSECRRQIDEGIASQFRVEQALGMALYGKSEEGLPLWGEHTAETLAMEATQRLAASPR